MGDLMKDLAEVSDAWRAYLATTNSYDCRRMERSVKALEQHHATIQQNAEAAKRLKALERALAAISPLASTTAYKIRKRADEILREGEPHDQD